MVFPSGPGIPRQMGCQMSCQGVRRRGRVGHSRGRGAHVAERVKGRALQIDEVLDITALLGEDLPSKPTAERARLLLAIPDDAILRLVLARLKLASRLPTTDLRFALDTLGCGPNMGRHHWLTQRGLPEMRGMLARATLSQLARDYTYERANRHREALCWNVAHSALRRPAQHRGMINTPPQRTSPRNRHYFREANIIFRLQEGLGHFPTTSTIRSHSYG